VAGAPGLKSLWRREERSDSSWSLKEAQDLKMSWGMGKALLTDESPDHDLEGQAVVV
jgi:hypothetical protein